VVPPPGIEPGTLSLEHSAGHPALRVHGDPGGSQTLYHRVAAGVRIVRPGHWSR